MTQMLVNIPAPWSRWESFALAFSPCLFQTAFCIFATCKVRPSSDMPRFQPWRPDQVVGQQRSYLKQGPHLVRWGYLPKPQMTWHHRWDYPLVVSCIANWKMAIEIDRNSGFSHWKWWFSIGKRLPEANPSARWLPKPHRSAASVLAEVRNSISPWVQVSGPNPDAPWCWNIYIYITYIYPKNGSNVR